MIATSHPIPRSFLAIYAIRRGLTPPSLKALGYVLNCFERSLGHAASWDDFELPTIERWTDALFARGLDPESIRGRRTALIGFWREAHDAGVIQSLPGRLRRIKVPDKPPICWDKPEYVGLLAITGALKGTMNRDPRILRADFWTCWIRSDYDGGFRLGDLRRLLFSQIASDGTVQLVQRKTGETIIGHFSAETMALIERLRQPGRRLVFGDLVNHSNAQRYFRKLVSLAGLQGSTKWLRRTGATWCEVETPGSAPAFLGHKDFRTAYKSYVDRSKTQRHKPRPPRIG